MWELYLADVDSTTGRWISPIMDSLTQQGTTLEGGGLDNWSAALAVEIAPGLSAGVTLSYATGSYSYERNYHEIDTRGLYEDLPYDFAELTLDEYVDSDISAFRSKIGFLYRAPDIFRAAFTVRPPAVLVVSETFSTRATAVYDNGDILPVEGPYTTSGTGAYDVLTPWTFGAGISLVLGPLLVSGDVEYTDWTQLEFRDAAVDLLDLNKDIKTLFRGTFEVRAGAELYIPWPGLRLRGGAMYLPSRYAGDPESFDQKYVTAGVGFLLGSSAMFDVAYAAGWWKSYRANYGGSSRVDESITTHNILATLSYRF
jgi:long-subunit fatty acid transport protein